MNHFFTNTVRKYEIVGVELTFGWSETLVISWRSTRVQVMKKMLSKQDGSGVYQMYIKMMPSMHTTYAVVASSITWMWLQDIFIIR